MLHTLYSRTFFCNRRAFFELIKVALSRSFAQLRPCWACGTISKYFSKLNPIWSIYYTRLPQSNGLIFCIGHRPFLYRLKICWNEHPPWNKPYLTNGVHRVHAWSSRSTATSAMYMYIWGKKLCVVQWNLRRQTPPITETSTMRTRVHGPELFPIL